jgi:hypothetical protein
VKAQSVQGAFEQVHAHNDSEGHRPEDWEEYEAESCQSHDVLHGEDIDELAKAQIEENL